MSDVHIHYNLNLVEKCISATLFHPGTSLMCGCRIDNLMEMPDKSIPACL